MSRIVTAVVLLITGALGLNNDPEEDRWVGQTAILLERDVKLRILGIARGTASGFEVKVLEVKNHWIRIRDLYGNEGWIEKRQAVPVTEAVEHFTKRIAKDPGDAEAHRKRATAYEHLDKLQDALDDISRAMALNREWDALFFDRALLLVKLRRYPDAMKDFDEYLRLNPDSGDAYNSRGNCWRFQKEYRKAIADYDESIRLDPKNVMPFNNRANAWLAMKEYDKAIADYTTAIQLSPRAPIPWSNRGMAHRRKKDYEKALADLDEATRLDPSFPSPYRHRAMLWATAADPKFRNPTKALEAAEKARELWGADYCDEMTALAAAYAELAKFDDAVKWAEKALELASEDEKKECQQRLELVRNKKPIRQP